MVAEAKVKAFQEGTTMTEILVQGLKARLERGHFSRDLPVSKASGGLASGVDWDQLETAEPEGELYR